MEQFEEFPFESDDALEVVPVEAAAKLAVTLNDVHVKITKGRSIRVPARMNFVEFKGFRIPVHLINLTGAGPETLDSVGKDHIAKYKQFVGLHPGMTILEMGCGIGRDAFQFMDFLDNNAGKYIGVDVTRDSIMWCRNNITKGRSNFTFHHFDAFNELYNLNGTRTSMDLKLPIPASSVDRIVLASVFTHLLEDEIIHYLTEFRRVLKPGGRIFASLFLYSENAVAAAAKKGTTLTFGHLLRNGVYVHHPQYPRWAVAYNDQAMKRMIATADLRLVRPYLKGSWSGLHENADDGQDVAICGIA